MTEENRRPLLNIHREDEDKPQIKRVKMSIEDYILTTRLYELYFAEVEQEEPPQIPLRQFTEPQTPTIETWLTYKAYILKTMKSKVTLTKCDKAIEIACDNQLMYFYEGEILHLAASLKDETFLKELLMLKQNVESCFKDRVTALMIACDNPNPKSAECLIKRNANVNAKDYEGRTPLHYAARNPNKEVAEVLLSNGADLNARDNVGRTPLMAAAASNSNAAVAELLLEKGADLYARDNQGWNALDHAKMMNCNPLIQDILIGRGLSHILDQEILDIFSAKHSIPFELPSNADQAELDALADAIFQDSLDWEAKQSN